MRQWHKLCVPVYAIRVNVIAADAFVVKWIHCQGQRIYMFVSIFSIQYQNLINFVVIKAEMIYIRECLFEINTPTQFSMKYKLTLTGIG